MIFRKFRYPLMFRLLGFYSNFLCKRYVNEFSDFRKIIKSSYLRAQKELWELPLHRYIRNGLLMCLKVFLDCLGTIWTLFFNKTIKIPGLITLCQSVDKSYAPIFWRMKPTSSDLISTMNCSIHFGFSSAFRPMHVLYGKIESSAVLGSTKK